MLLMAKEALIGLTIGLMAQAIFSGVEFCGQLVATQMGLAIAVQFDPTMEGQFTAMAVLQNLLAMLLFLSLGVHHFFFSALVDSYQTLPVGSWHVTENLVHFLVGLVGQVIVIGIKLAAPVMVSLLATTVVLGVMARAFPQMNIFIVSLPLNIGIGFLVLGFTVLAFLKTLQGAFGQIPLHLKTLFKLLS
jgi:flagellar biosynthetic protein FliR